MKKNLVFLLTILLFSCNSDDTDTREFNFALEEVYSISQVSAFVKFSSLEVDADYSLAIYKSSDLYSQVDSLEGVHPNKPISLCYLEPSTNYLIKLYALKEDHISPPKTMEFLTDEVGVDDQTIVVEVTNPATGRTWMDRNLGAERVSQAINDSRSYGDLYQWGRRADGHEKRASAVTQENATTVQPGHGMFISGNATWNDSQNFNLWEGVDAINNPCPCGFRLPTQQELIDELETWNTKDANGALLSELKFSLTGYRANADGSVASEGNFGYYWSSEASDMSGLDLGINQTNAHPSSHHQAGGASVRCIKDY